MLDSEIAQTSGLFPAGFRRDFDAHIYYDSSSRQTAADLFELARRDFKNQPIFVGSLVDRKVGPHPTPMFEINFPIERFGEMVLWLFLHRNGLTVLVHQVTGDDPKDHSSGALWLGAPVKLDVTKLDPSPPAN